MGIRQCPAPRFGQYGTGTNAVRLVYSGNEVTSTDARGAQRTRTYGSVNGQPVLTGLRTAATADSAATGWSFGYDANGALQSATTRSGEVRQYSAEIRSFKVKCHSGKSMKSINISETS